jgi:hypothetical protein
MAPKLAQRSVYLGGVGKWQWWIVVCQPVQTVYLKIDRHALGRCRLQLMRARVFLPQLSRELSIKELSNGLGASVAR